MLAYHPGAFGRIAGVGGDPVDRYGDDDVGLHVDGHGSS